MVKGGGYEPILLKQTILDMNLIQVLDSDHLSVVKIHSDPLLDEYVDVSEGLGKLAGHHHHHHRSAAEQATTSFLQPQRSCANSDSLPGANHVVCVSQKVLNVSEKQGSLPS